MKDDAHKYLESLKKELQLETSGLERDEAAGFFQELADWAYANAEAMAIDDGPYDDGNYDFD